MTDPIHLIGTALTGIVGGSLISSLFGGSKGSDAPQTQQPSAPPPASAPQMQPAQTRPKPKSNTPSFIGSAAVPDSRSFGSKTLLGQ